MNAPENLIQWLRKSCSLTDFQLTSLPADASFRQYYRLTDAHQSYIVMDASKEKSSCIPFVAIADALRDQGVTTPFIFEKNTDAGFLLLSDFGNQLLLNTLKTPKPTSDALALYKKALQTLLKIQTCSKVTGWTLPLFTDTFMREELALFQKWFLETHLALSLSKTTTTRLQDTFTFLAKEISLQPMIFMHRDYHSANLMVLPLHEIGVLDFQDAFFGPITYDLASLLRDCYISCKEEWITQLLTYYWELSSVRHISFDEFLYWFDLTSLQRQLKALLTFSRKYHRDQNGHYLQHIPRTLQSILKTSQRYPETHFLYEFLSAVSQEKCER